MHVFQLVGIKSWPSSGKVYVIVESNGSSVTTDSVAANGITRIGLQASVKGILRHRGTGALRQLGPAPIEADPHHPIAACCAKASN